MSDTQGLVAGILLLFAVIVYTFWPDRSAEAQPGRTRLDYLGVRKAQLEDNLRDLEFEYHAGKYTEPDYLAQRKALEQESEAIGAEIARQSTM